MGDLGICEGAFEIYGCLYLSTLACRRWPVDVGFFDFTGRVGVVVRFMAAIVKTKTRYSENQKPAIVKTENLLENQSCPALATAW